MVEKQEDLKNKFKIDHQKIEFILNNSSEYSMDHFLFDPHNVVNTFLHNHPKFASQYNYKGLWKPNVDDNTLTVIFHQNAY